MLYLALFHSASFALGGFLKSRLFRARSPRAAFLLGGVNRNQINL